MSERVQRLDLFDNSEFDRGSSKVFELLWLAVQSLLFSSWLPGSRWRCSLLRAFGASIGEGVVIKPHVIVKFPWRLTLGDHVWIGERVWIDNLAEVTIEDHACISQGVYFCTGSHDWTDSHFKLVTKPISIGRGAWVCALARLAPGCVLEDGAVLALGCLGVGKLRENTIRFDDGKERFRVNKS